MFYSGKWIPTCYVPPWERKGPLVTIRTTAMQSNATQAVAVDLTGAPEIKAGPVKADCPDMHFVFVS